MAAFWAREAILYCCPLSFVPPWWCITIVGLNRAGGSFSGATAAAESIGPEAPVLDKVFPYPTSYLQQFVSNHARGVKKEKLIENTPVLIGFYIFSAPTRTHSFPAIVNVYRAQHSSSKQRTCVCVCTRLSRYTSDITYNIHTWPFFHSVVEKVQEKIIQSSRRVGLYARNIW